MGTGYLIQFYIACLILSFGALPISYRLCNRFADGGFMISKSLGLYISGYAMWLLSSAHILRFTQGSCVIVLLLTAALIYTPVIISVYKKKDNGFVQYLRSHSKNIIIAEIVFLLIFVILNWIFAHRIPSTDTERMMDIGFMMSMYKTDYMPPLDLWASGEIINYYYFGQYIMTYLTKISFIPVGYGYTFGFFMIAAWASVSIFLLVYDITHSRIAGVVSGAATIFSGNFHYVVFAKIVPMLWDILQLEGDKPSYWFADSTRYIGYTPEVTTDRTIHEFPSYSFIVGDLHAHVVNILIVVVILTLLWAYLKSLSDKKNEIKPVTKKTKTEKKEDDKPSFKGSPLLSECCNGYFLLIGFLLGISSMSNYWDFPIYYVVSGSIILFGLMRVYGIKKGLWGRVILSGLFIMLINMAVSFVFNMKFNKMVSGIGIVTRRSLFHQLVLLWGFPVIMLICFIILLIRKRKLDEKKLYTLLLGLCATGLVVIPEFIFVKDIYIDAFPRANTMFKLGYEAFIMFGICCGIIINTFFETSKEEEGYKAYLYKKTAVIFFACFLMTLGYFVTATRQWIDDYSKDNFHGFDAYTSIRNANTFDLKAIEELEKLVEASGAKQPVVLEADGDSYTNTCRVSVLTGYPTVLGWHTHEWLWHNSHSYMEQRRIDVKDIYTSEDAYTVRHLLDKYNVDYVFIGSCEYSKFEVVQNGILESMGQVVYWENSDTGQLIEIIKVR